MKSVRKQINDLVWTKVRDRAWKQASYRIKQTRGQGSFLVREQVGRQVREQVRRQVLYEIS